MFSLGASVLRGKAAEQRLEEDDGARFNLFEWENRFKTDMEITRASSFFVVYKNNNDLLHNEVSRSTKGHTLHMMEELHGVSERSEESAGSGAAAENTENSSYLFFPDTKKGFNEQLRVPSGDPCCHESCSISVPFHPAPLLQT